MNESMELAVPTITWSVFVPLCWLVCHKDISSLYGTVAARILIGLPHRTQ